MGILLFFYRKTSEACVRCIGEMPENCPGANLPRTYTERGKRRSGVLLRAGIQLASTDLGP